MSYPPTHLAPWYLERTKPMAPNKLLIPTVSLVTLFFLSSFFVLTLGLSWLRRRSGEQHHRLKVTASRQHFKHNFQGRNWVEILCCAQSSRGADKSLASPGMKQANVSVRMAWISFSALPCREKKNLMTTRVSMLLKSRASLTCFRALFLFWSG